MSIYAEEFERRLIDFRIDIKSPSFTYDDADKWIALSHHPDYPVFKACRAALQRLLLNEKWLKLRSGELARPCILDL